MVTRSPILRSSRASRVESAAAPNAPYRAASWRSKSADRHFRIERQCAEHRVGAVHRLDLDQSEPAVAGARHGAQRRRDRYFAARTQKGDFVGLGFALDQRESDVAAEQRAALARQPLAEAGRDRADAGNRHHAERDAGDENVKAAQAAAQFAQAHSAAQATPRGCRRIGSATMRHEAAVAIRRLAIDPARAQPHHAIAALRQRGVVGHQHQRHAALGVFGEQADRRSACRWLRRDCRWARPPPGWRDRAPARGPAPRAAARRRTIAWDNDAAGRRGRPMSIPAPRAATHRDCRRVPAAPRHFPAPSWSGSDETTGTRCRPGGRESAPAHPRRGH